MAPVSPLGARYVERTVADLTVLVPQALEAVTFSVPVVHAEVKFAVMALVPCPLATVAPTALKYQL